LEHRTPRELHDEPSTPRYVRRMFHPGRTGLGGPRPRRGGYMNSGGSSGSGVAQSSSTAASLNNRETIDPIAELLSQLSGVRRSAQQSSAPVQSQLQLLQQQLQLERQQVQQTRERLERLPRRHVTATSSAAQPITVVSQETSNTSASSQFLLAKNNEPVLSESEKEVLEVERADRGLFVQDLILSTLELGNTSWKRRVGEEDDEMTDVFANLNLGLSQRGTSGHNAATSSGHGAADSSCCDSQNCGNDIEVICLDSDEKDENS